MAEAATKLPVKSEKSAASASVGNRTSPFETLRREIDRLFDDFHPFGWRLPSTRSMFEFEAPKGSTSFRTSRARVATQTAWPEGSDAPHCCVLEREAD